MALLGAGLATRRTPERNSPLLGGIPLPYAPSVYVLANSATTPVTATAAQILSGMLRVNCDDTATLTLPTATLLNAAIEGIYVGMCFEFSIINSGDTTLTVAVGTGITNKLMTQASTTVSAVLTIVSNASKRFRLECTGVANPSDPSTSDAWDLLAYGSVAAAVA